MTEPEAITVDELAAALVHVEHLGSKDDCANCRGKAVSLLSHILAHREPEYEPGEIYRDADGKIWLYQPERNYACEGSWADCPWLKPGDRAAYSLNSPKRPLRKLVPEGSPLADSERDLIHADLGKLLDLLGLGDYARPQSSHEVFLTCLEEVAKLKRWTNA